MTTEKPTSEKKLLDDALDRLWTIESYQNEIISCLHESDSALGELNYVIDNFPREFNNSKEKLNSLLDAAYRLEGWAIAHHQDIRQLSEILTQIEKTQSRKPGGKK